MDGYVGLDIIKTNVTDHVVPWTQIDNAISKQSVSEIYVDRALERISKDEISQVFRLWKSLLIKNATVTLIGVDFERVSKLIASAQPSEYEKYQQELFGFKVGNLNFQHVHVYTKQQIVDLLTKLDYKIVEQIDYEDFQYKIIATVDSVEQIQHTTVRASKSVPHHNATSISFAVFGLQRTGTNFMQRFITHNTKNAFHKQGWKHDLACPQEGRGVVRIYMYKTPYKWIESIHKNHEDVPKRWGEKYMLMTIDGADDIMIDTKHRGSDNNVKMSLRRLCRLYNEHLINWYDTSTNPESNILMVNYEKMVKDPQKWLNDFSIDYKFDITSANIHIPDKVQQSNKFTDKDRQYYTNTKDFRYLDDGMISLINETVDSKVFDLLNIERL